MEDEDMKIAQETIETGVMVLNEYIKDIFIDRRIHIEKGIPEEKLDRFIASKLAEFNKRTEAMSFGEVMSFMNETIDILKENCTDLREMSRERIGGRRRKPGPLEELEIKLRSISEVRKGLIDLEVDRELLDKAICDRARQCQEEIDNLTADEFDRLIIMNVLEAQARHMKIEEEEKEEQHGE